MEHLTAGSHLTLITVIGNLTVYQRFAMVNATSSRHIRVGHVLCKQRVVPKFAGFVRHVSPKSRRLIAGEKYRETLGTHTQVQVADSHLSDFGFTKRASCHGFEYS